MKLPLLTITLLTPVVGALLITILPTERKLAIKTTAAIATGISLILSLVILFNYNLKAGGLQMVENIPWIADLGVSYRLGVDGLSLPMLLLTNLIGFSCIFASWRVNERVKEFFVPLLILISGVMGTFITTDLFIFFLFYEVVVIPIYLLIIMFGSSKRVTKEYAGMKLTIYLLIGSALILLGFIWMFVTGHYLTGKYTMDMYELARVGFPAELQVPIFVLLVLGFGTLLSMFPFHAWSPDGYAGAPTAVSMIHAGVLKKIGGYALIRIGIFILPLGAKAIAPYIAVLGLANVIYAALICMRQTDLKYVVGYSSVSHMGYVVIGIAALNLISINGAVMMMFAHGVMAALFFAMVGSVYEKSHTRNIPELGGLAHQMPVTAFGFMLAGLASLGLPGLVTFIGEFTIFVGAFRVYNWIAVLAISGVVFTAVYVLRALGNVLFGPRKAEWDHLQDLKGLELVPLVVLGLAIIIPGMLPASVMDYINSGAGALMTAALNVPPGGGLQ